MRLRAGLPVVLGVEVQPVRPAVLVAPADAGYRRRRIPEQEVGERVAGELPGVGEGAARVVRLLRPQLQVVVVGAELHAVRPAVERHVVEELEVVVVAGREDRRIAHGAVQAARRNLREADVARVGGHPQQTDLLAKGLPRLTLTCPPSTVIQPKRSSFSMRVAEHVRVARDEVPRLRRQRAAESGHERLLQRARAERLEIVGVERAEAREQLVGVRQLMVEPRAELVEIAGRLLDRGQVLDGSRSTSAAARAASSAAAIGSMRLGGDLVVGERRADAGRRDRQRIADRAADPRSCRRGPRRSARRRSASVNGRIRSAFEAAEEERPVLDERAADRPAELVLPQRRDRLTGGLEIVRRIERVVAIELEQAAAERVGAGLGGDVDEGRGFAAELGAGTSTSGS